MKKIIILTVAAGFFAAGCASTGNTEKQTSFQPMTFEEALQKSQETRQQLESAKQAYTQAQVVSDVASGSQNIGEAAKTQVKKQIDTAKTKIKAEKEAWEDVLKN